MKHIFEKPIWKPVPDGTYQTVFLGLEHQPTKKGPAKRWCFKIINDNEYSDEIVSFLTDPKYLRLNDKINRILCSLIGKQYQLGETVQTSGYIGMEYEVDIQDGNIFNFKQSKYKAGKQ